MDENLCRILIIVMTCDKVTLRFQKVCKMPNYLLTTLRRDTKLLESHFKLEKPVGSRENLLSPVQLSKL